MIIRKFEACSLEKPQSERFDISAETAAHVLTGGVPYLVLNIKPKFFMTNTPLDSTCPYKF